jgi:hypothetical protein
MIVHDLDRFRALWSPTEADAPLLIDPDGILTAAIAPQGFEPISRRGTKVIRTGRGVDHVKLAQRYSLDASPSCRTSAIPE